MHQRNINQNYQSSIKTIKFVKKTNYANCKVQIFYGGNESMKF